MELLGGGADPNGETGWLALKCDVSKGYYVRSLARDLAASLGTLGHLTALRLGSAPGRSTSKRRCPSTRRPTSWGRA